MPPSVVGVNYIRTGIGSTGVVAVREGRRFVGAELKRSYYQQAVANLRNAEVEARTPDLFALAGVAVE